MPMPFVSSQNVMATDDGVIPGESESTDGLIDQYRRYAMPPILVTMQLKAPAGSSGRAVVLELLLLVFLSFGLFCESALN